MKLDRKYDSEIFIYLFFLFSPGADGHRSAAPEHCLPRAQAGPHPRSEEAVRDGAEGGAGVAGAACGGGATEHQGQAKWVHTLRMSINVYLANTDKRSGYTHYA